MTYFITNCEKNLSQNASALLLQNLTVLLQNATNILQNTTFVPKQNIHTQINIYIYNIYIYIMYRNIYI